MTTAELLIQPSPTITPYYPPYYPPSYTCAQLSYKCSSGTLKPEAVVASGNPASDANCCVSASAVDPTFVVHTIADWLRAGMRGGASS
jgi:hypothetical protein